MRIKFIIALLVLLFTGAELMAQPIARFQRAVVPPGIRQGAITPGEARQLRQMRTHIRRDIRVARGNDGRIGPLEGRHIRREIQQYKRQRNRALHNRRMR